MIETVSESALPVDEKLTIRKNRLKPLRPTGTEKRFCIVTGTHGDELEGQAVCFEINRLIQENIKYLKGIVDIYPALNPLGVDSITRGIPMFDLDMNRIFPGSQDGATAEYTASQIINDIAGADVCIDIHASNIFLTEITQVRINEVSKDSLLPLAKHLNVDFIWIHSAATVLESTLAYSLNLIGTKTLVVEMGVGMRITKTYCQQLVDGIFHLMKELDIWDGDVPDVRTPVVSTDGKVTFLNAQASGILITHASHQMHVKKGQHLGDIVNPLYGRVEHKITSPCDGLLFTLREYPVVYEGSLVARILEGI